MKSGWAIRALGYAIVLMIAIVPFKLFGELSREEMVPWLAIGIPTLFVGAFLLDRWLKPRP